jgi:hypothetical protein
MRSTSIELVITVALKCQKLPIGGTPNTICYSNYSGVELKIWFVRVKISCDTVKPLYVKHVNNWFLKLVLYYLNKYIFKNHLSTCSR